MRLPALVRLHLDERPGPLDVLAYAVGRRVREIAIRAALGASGARLVGVVIGRTAVLLSAGMMLGICGAWISGPFFSRILYDVNPRDPLTIAAASVLMWTIGMVACWNPGRRAFQVDPAVALREE